MSLNADMAARIRKHSLEKCCIVIVVVVCVEIVGCRVITAVVDCHCSGGVLIVVVAVKELSTFTKHQLQVWWKSYRI